MEAYVRELKSMNCLIDDTIHAGNYLTVTYYKACLLYTSHECRQIEGYNTANWILMDYNDIIVHVFSREDRLFYDLERIWRDGKQIASIDEL